jgi:short-subunit dehydrogenase
LTKLFLKDFEKNGGGYIMNVASLAAYMPGPRMAAYYASKAYVTKLTEAIWFEQRKKGSKVKITAVCPGPVKTEFWKNSNLKINIPSPSAEKVAKKAIEAMFKNKAIVVPGGIAKATKAIAFCLPKPLMRRLMYRLHGFLV